MPIPVGEKLAVTLRYLTTGESFKSLMYQFHIHRTTVSLFVLTVVFRNTSFCKELENDQLIRGFFNWAVLAAVSLHNMLREKSADINSGSRSRGREYRPMRLEK